MKCDVMSTTLFCVFYVRDHANFKKLQRVRKRYQRMAPYCKRRRGDGATRGWRFSNTLKATASHAGDQHATQSLVAAVLSVSYCALLTAYLML